MADIASAIKMEEEALQQMKKQSLKRTVNFETRKSSNTKGITNPNCKLGNHVSVPNSSQPSSKVETDADLMSFQDIRSGSNQILDFNISNGKVNKNSSRSAYDKSIDDVLSLYNKSTSNLSPGRTLPQFHSQSFYQHQPIMMGYQVQRDGQYNRSVTFGQQSVSAYTSTDAPYFQWQHYPNTAAVSTTQRHSPGISNSSLLVSKQQNHINAFSDQATSTKKNPLENLGESIKFTKNVSFPRPASLGQLDTAYKTDSSTKSLRECNNQSQKSSSRPTVFSDDFKPEDENAIFRSSSFSSSSQVDSMNSSNRLQSDKLTSVFDEWLNNGWTSNSVTSSPQHSCPTDKKPTPNWLEWDPLNKLTKESSTDAEARNKDGTQFLVSTTLQATAAKDDKNNSAIFEFDHSIGYQLPQQDDDDAPSSSIELDEATELERFGRSLAQLHADFLCDDVIGNPGHVISPMLTCEYWRGQESCEVVSIGDESSTVRISVTSEGIEDPVTFECAVSASVEHVIIQALCIAYEDISSVVIGDFFFKAADKQEYFISQSRLSMYQYVQDCRKFEQEIRLELLHKSKLDRSLRRTVEDDRRTTVAEEFLKSFSKPANIVSREDIQILLETFYGETGKLLEGIQHETEVTSLQQLFDRVVQAVKAMCSALGNVETHEISHSIGRLREQLGLIPATPTHTRRSVHSNNSVVADSPTKLSNLQNHLEHLISAMLDYIQLYCKVYEVDAYDRTCSDATDSFKASTISSASVRELYSVHVLSLHRIPKQWEMAYDAFYVTCSLFHGDRQVNNSSSSTDYMKITKDFYPTVYWNKWIDFAVYVCELPLEVTLRVVLLGVQRSDDKVATKKLAWLNIPVFDHQGIMKHRSGVFGMWDYTKFSKFGRLEGPLNCQHDIVNLDSVALHLAFSEEKNPSTVVEHALKHSDQLPTKPIKWKSIDDLVQNSQHELKSAASHARLTAGPLFNLSQREKEILWQNRHVASSSVNNNDVTPVMSLPVLLHCVPSWSPTLQHVQAAYDLLASWPKPVEPEECLALLTSSIADTRVRSAAVQWLEQYGVYEVSCWLPQLVQALRCEQRHDSPLARMLLRQALSNIRICHQLYWLLYDNMWSPSHVQRYTVLHAALVTVCGGAMKKEFEKENYFLRKINKIAEAVKDAKDASKATLLNQELGKLVSQVNGRRFRIPTNPALTTSGINVQNSSYFSSNAVPLKLAFINDDVPTTDLLIMYKVGDDLRQDALTMQLIRVMDRMWLGEGLDLRIVTFDCLPTGPVKGMVEIIPDSKTFREIQSSYGLAGAFKDKPIAEWLQKYNPTGMAYERAVENFTLSCAGYCVATYVLGICDRHNDNIMLRTSGHLFHIDFARFLGHAQMFGNIKRDRAPFVLTSDMAYVINGGDRPSSKFHDFVDVCCLAFNVLRKRAHTLINLLALMLNCGIPELSSKADLKYVYDTLKPNASDTEATTMFTRLIESSLSSSFTRFNFFIHNLAQMRFHGNETEEDKKVLSFSPQIHGHRDEEGIIASASVVGYQKRYNPEKYYLYCVKVTRERNSSSIDSYVFRTFDEFEELHRKLSYNTSLHLPSFPNSVVVGRSQVKQVAEKRKDKLNIYLRHLLGSARNVSMHDLVYTFFHPILRDEEKAMSVNTKTHDLTVSGEIKLSLHYKNSALYIMVHHCKNLSPVDGTDPDPYVKTYLLPDPHHVTKRKTKVVRKSLHPTYNEMLVYQMPLNEVTSRRLCVGVWNYESFQENDHMGSVVIDLATADLAVESSKWYLLKSGSQ